jgi:nitrous oxide reductase accessory protein NosL
MTNLSIHARVWAASAGEWMDAQVGRFTVTVGRLGEGGAVPAMILSRSRRGP